MKVTTGWVNGIEQVVEFTAAQEESFDELAAKYDDVDIIGYWRGNDHVKIACYNYYDDIVTTTKFAIRKDGEYRCLEGSEFFGEEAVTRFW